MRFLTLNNLRCVFCIGVTSAYLGATPPATASGWEDRVSTAGPGDFPAMATPFRATYRLGWSNVTAARANVVIKRPSPDAYDFRADAATVGAARTLFTIDATMHSTVSTAQLRPLSFEQNEVRSDKTLREILRFDAGGAERTRTETFKSGGKAPRTETKRFDSRALQDFVSAYFYLRSLPLANGDSQTVAIMSPSVPYLMTVTVRGREEISTRAGRFRAIRISVDAIQRVKDDGTLMPHKRFKNGTVWLSDDSMRQILRVQSQIFIGVVFVEIESVTQIAAGR